MADIGAPELLIVLAVIVLLFGASKLPDLARGTGQALRIFKAETSGAVNGEAAAATPRRPDESLAPDGTEDRTGQRP